MIRQLRVTQIRDGNNHWHRFQPWQGLSLGGCSFSFDTTFGARTHFL